MNYASTKFRAGVLRIKDWMVKLETYARGWLRGERIIHVIGDSHVLAYRAWRPFVVHYVGPATMHNLFEVNSRNQSLSKLKRSLRWVRPNRDAVLMVFGEIDCRIHFYYQYKKRQEKQALPKLIQATVRRFMAGTLNLKESGYEVIIQGVAAPGRETNQYGYPDYAKAKTRVSIYQEFNRQLMMACKQHGLEFWELYARTADREGMMLAEMAQDIVHLKPEALKRVVESEYHGRFTDRSSQTKQ